MKFLKNHPFAVEAFFEKSTVLTFAVKKEELAHKIPPCLSLDTFQDEWAFIAAAFVQTKSLRPKGFPTFMGNDFFLIGYRIFVRYTDARGKNLRGLYIIKSETDQPKMTFFGNIFTHYNYSTTDILATTKDKINTIQSQKSDFVFSVDYGQRDAALPENSPFNTWKEARRFAGPLPFTFTYNEADKSVLIIEGVRQNWNPQPIAIEQYRFSFLDKMHLDSITLANAFEIENVPYHWKKGRIEKWQ